MSTLMNASDAYKLAHQKIIEHRGDEIEQILTEASMLIKAAAEAGETSCYLSWRNQGIAKDMPVLEEANRRLETAGYATRFIHGNGRLVLHIDWAGA